MTRAAFFFKKKLTDKRRPKKTSVFSWFEGDFVRNLPKQLPAEKKKLF